LIGSRVRLESARRPKEASRTTGIDDVFRGKTVVDSHDD
jgi:hypothetical protein